MLRIFRTGVAIALLAGASFAAQSAGLGKLTVSSALGQVLAAEIDLVSLQPGEFETLTARVASPEDYREAKIEYAPVLRSLRFAVMRRGNGQPFLKVTSVSPINDPFVDVLIEMTWPSGRLQREYPILLDPPGFAEARVAAPLAAVVRPVPTATSPPAAVAEAAGSPSAKAEMAGVAGPARDAYGPVKKGDNLTKIASGLKTSSVNLNQMLVALYRENRSAFIDNNMNLLKAGQVLRIPSAATVEAITEKEASREYRTHVANWKAYRQGLAGSAAAMTARSGSARTSAGQVGTVAVSPPPAPVTSSQDVLKLSKTQGAKGSAASGKGGASQDRLHALQEEIISRDKALQESQSRVADLEKQIRDMQRLMDLKVAAPVKPGEPTKAPETKVAAAAPAAAPKATEAPKPAEAPKAVETPKTVSATPPADSKAAATTPVPTPVDAAKPPAKPAVKPAAPAPEPGLVDQLMDNPLILAGGIGIASLLGLGGFLFLRNRRSKAEAVAPSVISSAFPSDLRLNTADSKSGGGLVDTGNSSFLTDFDKAGADAISTEEVDPVAEAEVYIAYGRDAQAEEILKEAMTRDNNRHEIPLKLLEIYHARKSKSDFEAVASKLQHAVGPASATWRTAAAMGAQIDPSNPLYKAAGVASGEPVEVETSLPVSKPDLDFDLDLTPSAGTVAATEAPAPDFDISLDADMAQPTDLPVSNESKALDFDLAPSATPGGKTRDSDPSAADANAAFDFDLSALDKPPSQAAGTPAHARAPSDSIDLADLDLSEDEGDGTAGGDPVTTKFELARAYLEIGDKDGAREILQEVAKEGSAAQVAEAKKLIASL